MDTIGLVALIFAALFNGTAFVPVKLCAKWHRKHCDSDTYDMVVFQGWWGLAAAVAMMLTAPIECAIQPSQCLRFSYYAFLTGASIFTATVAVLISVHHLGVGLEPSVVAAFYVVCGFVEDLLLLHNIAEPLSACALGLLLLGAAGVVACRKLSPAPAAKDAQLLSSAMEHDTPMSECRTHHAPSAAPTRLVTGLVAGFATGLFGSMVPFTSEKAVGTDGDPMPPFAYAAPVGVGLVAVNFVVTPLRIAIRRWSGAAVMPTQEDCAEGSSAKSSAQQRATSLALYGTASGLIWGAGAALLNFGLDRGVELSTANAMYQCALLVGGLWGIFFGEIRGWRAIVCFLVSAAALLGAVVLMGLYVHPS